VANPVEYLQEKARRSTSVPLLKSHLPHARRSGGEEQRNKSATACTAKSHPTNLPTLQSAYSNRPTTQKGEQKIQQQTKQQVATMPETARLLLQCPHTYHHMPSSSSSIIPRANHQQIKQQHHNHQSTSHPPPHHRHHPSSTISSSSRRHSPGQQQPLPTGEQHRASPRFSKRSPHIKEIIISGKRICRFSAAAPSAQSIESPRSRPANET